MHQRNKLRLLAGLTIDVSLEVTPVVEARNVPMSRSELKAKTPETIEKHTTGISKAIVHLRNAVKALERIPATDFGGDVPYFIHKIEGIITDDGAGMETYLTAITRNVAESVEEVTESEFGEEEPQTRVSSEANFAVGDQVLYDNGIWIVHVSDAKADTVGVIPPGMKNASKEEKAKAMQQVKFDKIRKPSPEETKIMAGPDGILGTADDVTLESTLNYTQSNNLTHEDNEDSDPINVVGQGEKQWANSLDMKEVEYPTSQLDDKGAQSMDDEVNKVKVPKSILKSLKGAAKAFEDDAEKVASTGHSAQEKKQHMIDTAAAFNELLGFLEGGTIMDIKKAQIYVSSLMGPMVHSLPDGIWDFISKGGQSRSLKDYMNKVK